MQTYSFRAECAIDVQNFDAEAEKAQLPVSYVAMMHGGGLPDVEVEFESSATLEALRNAMRNVVDGHVMLQTLRAVSLSKNSLERDNTLH
jgi:hypothetical protein